MLETSPLIRYYSESIFTRVLERSSIRMLAALSVGSKLKAVGSDLEATFFSNVFLPRSSRLTPKSLRPVVSTYIDSSVTIRSAAG